MIYQGSDQDHFGKEICFAANEDTLTIVDVTDKAAPVQISRTGYDQSEYTHQAWLSEDHGLLFLDDELDEDRLGHNTRTRVWSLADLDAPAVIDEFFNTYDTNGDNRVTFDEILNADAAVRARDTKVLSDELFSSHAITRVPTDSWSARASAAARRGE